MSVEVRSASSVQRTVSPDPIADRIVAQGKMLSELTDAQLQETLKGMPKESLYPEDPYEKILWLDHMPYERILKVCDAEKASYLLCWVTAGNMLCNWDSVIYSCRALNVMNAPDRVAVFVEAVKLSRIGNFNTINVNDLLLRHYNEEGRNPFRGGLPENILKILNLENSLAVFNTHNYGKQDLRIEANLQQIIANRDAGLTKLVESLQKGKDDKPAAKLSDLPQKA